MEKAKQSCLSFPAQCRRNMKVKNTVSERKIAIQYNTITDENWRNREIVLVIKSEDSWFLPVVKIRRPSKSLSPGKRGQNKF